VIFAAITLYVGSQRVFIVIVCFVIDSVRKLSDIPSYFIYFETMHSHVFTKKDGVGVTP